MLDLVLDLLTVLVFSALLGLLALDTERRATRAAVVCLALLAIGISTWRGIRDGKWWMLLAGLLVAVAMIGVERWRARRSPTG